MSDPDLPSSPVNTKNNDDRISLSDVQQVRRVAEQLGISAERLREIIAQVGPRMTDVTARLSKPDGVD